MSERLLHPEMPTPAAPSTAPGTEVRPAWRRLAAALVVVHFAIAAARVPADVIGKRCERVADFRARGPIRFHLDNEFMAGADAVEWLVRHASLDSVVLHRGATSGASELVPPLIWPRLLYDESWVSGDERIPLRRPLARGPIDGRDAIAVLECDPERRGGTQALRIVGR